MAEFYVFKRKSLGLKGDKLGSLLAPDKHTAEVSARVMYGGHLVVQSAVDWKIEQEEVSALKRLNRDSDEEDEPVWPRLAHDLHDDPPPRAA